MQKTLHNLQKNFPENNTKLLAQYNAPLAEKIQKNTELQADYEVREAKSGDPILYRNSIPTDNEVDPVWDSLEKFNAIKDKNFRNITLVYGLGFGYQLRELAKRHRGRIIVYEPNLDFLRIAFELVDFSNELKNDRISICNTLKDIEEIAYARLFFLDYKLNIIFSDYYLNHEPENLAEFKAKLEEIHVIYQANYKNLMIRNLKWTEALFTNLPNIVKNQDLHALRNRLKGKTAVIISAGPSLDKNIKDLIPYRDKVVVFCVGTALKTAVKHGIIPDFVVVIEISGNTKSQLDIPELKDINVILSTNTYNEVFNLPAKRFLNYHERYTPASKWLGAILQINTAEYETAGTVAINALYSAKILGCDKIILIGQDLAYTGNKCYSQDTVYASLKVDDSGIVNYEEENSQSLSKNRERLSEHLKTLNHSLTKIKGQNGEMLLTRPDFLLFIKYFEKLAEKYSSDLTLINSTEGGVFLSGFRHISLIQALGEFALENTDAEKILMNSNCKLKPDEAKKRRKVIAAYLTDTVKRYYSIKKIAEQTFYNNILAHLKPQTQENYLYLIKVYQKSKILSEKEIQTEEEKEFLRERQKLAEEFYNQFLEQSKQFFKDDLQGFGDNLKIIHANYLKIKPVIESDVLLDNLIKNFLMPLNNMIVELDNTEEEVFEFYLRHYRVFTGIYTLYPSYIKLVKSIISEIT